jgi:hypothetical protein
VASARLTGRRGRRTRQGLLAAGAASCAVATGSLLLPEQPEARGGGSERTVFAKTTGNGSELVDTLPITQRPEREPRVVMSLGPPDLPELEHRDTLKVYAEVQATTTCVDRTARCIGRPYEFSPFISARLVLAAGKRVTGGRGAVSLARPKSVQCSQRRPHRNHHCVLTFQHAGKQIRDPGALPCPPSRCFVNLVVSAHNPEADPGNVVVVGADRPDGSILQDKGRLSVVLTTPASPGPRRARTTRRVHGRVPITRGDDWTSVYSVKFSNLQRGDILVAVARQRTSISPVPYNVYVGTRIILTGRPLAGRANRLSRRVSSLNGQLTEGNGFNCTHGRSAYRTPCTSRKAGMIEIRRPPRRGGRQVPMFVNLVCHTRPKLAAPQSGDHLNVLAHGSLTVSKYVGG